MLAQNNTGRRTMKLVSDHALKSIVCTHGFGRLVISPLRASSVRRYSTELNRCERDAWLLGARPHHQVRCWPDPEALTASPAGPLTEVDLPCRRGEWHGSF